MNIEKILTESLQRILLAAYRDQDTGIEWTGQTHAEATGAAYGAYRGRGGFLEYDDWLDEQFSIGDGCGFLTSDGKFVNREEAAAIAERASQTQSDNHSLHSQDIRIPTGT